jgi:hypothetical protein
MIDKDALAELDLDALSRELVRERAIRDGMARTGEGRQTVADMLDAMASMDQEAVLDLTEGEPTTLQDALTRYVRIVETWDEVIPRDRVAGDLDAILEYPWAAEEERLASHGLNSSVRLTVETRDDRDLSVKLGGWELARVSWEEAGSGGILAAEEVARAVHRSLLARIIADRDHHVQLNGAEVADLRAFLVRPNGSAWIGQRLTVDAVEGGGLLVRTRPYSYQHAHAAEARRLREEQAGR